MLQERDSAAFRRTAIFVQVCSILTVTGCWCSNSVKELATVPTHVPRRSGTLINRKALRNCNRQSQLSKAQYEISKDQGHGRDRNQPPHGDEVRGHECGCNSRHESAGHEEDSHHEDALPRVDCIIVHRDCYQPSYCLTNASIRVPASLSFHESGPPSNMGTNPFWQENCDRRLPRSQ